MSFMRKIKGTNNPLTQKDLKPSPKCNQISYEIMPALISFDNILRADAHVKIFVFANLKNPKSQAHDRADTVDENSSFCAGVFFLRYCFAAYLL